MNENKFDKLSLSEMLNENKKAGIEKNYNPILKKMFRDGVL